MVEQPSAAELAVLRVSRDSSVRCESGDHRYVSLNRSRPTSAAREFGADAVARAEALGLLDLIESPG